MKVMSLAVTWLLWSSLLLYQNCITTYGSDLWQIFAEYYLVVKLVSLE